MARIIIISARNWSFRDEQGAMRTGVTIEGTEANANAEPDYRGMGAIKYQASAEAWETLRNSAIPGVYDVELGLRRGKGGTATASIEGATLVLPIDMSPVRKAAA
jgi:hypothetical protein